MLYIKCYIDIIHIFKQLDYLIDLIVVNEVSG